MFESKNLLEFACQFKKLFRPHNGKYSVTAVENHLHISHDFHYCRYRKAHVIQEYATMNDIFKWLDWVFYQIKKQ